MVTPRAERWRRNALFRVLAFLDNTGVQAFALADDTEGDNGAFRHVDVTFGEASTMASILQASLTALRANIIRLFADREEKRALLQLFGTEGVEREASSLYGMTPLAQIEASALATAHSADSPQDAHAASGSPSAGGERHDDWQLPVTTPLSKALSRPSSLTAAAQVLDEMVPLHLYSRLTEVFRVRMTPESGEACASPLLEQLLIDGLDRWMCARSADANRQLVLACGVQPSLVEQVCARSPEEAARLFVDFVVDVVFPPSVSATDAAVGDSEDHASESGAVLDWLLLSYEKNHETVDVEDEESAQSSGAEASVASQSELNGWVPPDGEVVLTEENVDEYMRTHPEWIPEEVMRARRRPWTHPQMTQFELAHHYSLAELRSAVKDVLDSSADPAVQQDLEGKLGHAVPHHAVVLAQRARKKADCIEALLALHRDVQGVADTDRVSLSPPPEGSDALPHRNEKGIKGDETAVDTSLSVKELEKRYTLAQLKACIRSHFPEHSIPPTKQKCAKLIKSSANGRSTEGR